MFIPKEFRSDKGAASEDCALGIGLNKDNNSDKNQVKKTFHPSFSVSQ